MGGALVGIKSCCLGLSPGNSSFLKHGIAVFRFFRDILDHVPVLHDFSVFDPEDVHGSLAPVLRVQFNMVVDEHQVPVRPQMLDFRGAFWEFFQESGNAFFESLFPSLNPGLCWI